MIEFKNLSKEQPYQIFKKKYDEASNAGQKLIIPMENKQINVTVADPVFLDKENKRLNA